MDIESIQIHLNSKYADSYNNNNNLSDCIFQLPVIEIPLQHSIKLSLQHAVIPFSFYNINANNNQIQFQEIIVDGNGNQTGTINNTLYISYGNYNALQLAIYLGTLFPNNRMTVTYDNIRNKFNFTNSTYDFKFISSLCTCQELLGLSTNDLYNSSIFKTYTSNRLINLATVKCICVATNLQTGCITNIAKNETSILCSIPVISNPFSLIDYANTSQFKVDLHSNVINTVRIKLIDQDGNSINLNGMYFTLTLQLDIYNFVE